MGEVHLARDLRLGRLVAVKLLTTQNPDLDERFLAEARATARCRHENIVVIYEVGAHRGQPYMVLEFLEGQTLRQWMKDHATPARVPPDRAVELMLPVVRALAYAHDQGIVHRDLKPENVMLTGAGGIKVLDFGVAKHLGAAATPDPGPTGHDAGPPARGSALVGTPPYMSPEQLTLGAIDHRADVWAVGIMLFELVAGAHPVLDAPAPQVAQAAIADERTPMPSANERVPGLGPLAAVIDRCLIKNPAHRTASARVLLAELEALAEGRGPAPVGHDGSHPVAGELFAQRFLVEDRIATGGTGAFLRAIDQQTGRPVALKLLQPHGSTGAAQRFAREAQILAELHHPHIVSYVAHGVDEATQPYLAMEWLEGESLAERLRRGPLGLRDTGAVARGVSAALAEAHERGVIHRNLKPSNIFLSDRDPARVVVLDFGIARHVQHMGAVTLTGAMIGTPQYMSPEQMRGDREIGSPTDLFSLGCVLYECLAGAPPFLGEHTTTILLKVMLEEPKPIRVWRGDVPETFAGLIDRMLRKVPAERFPHGKALREALLGMELPEEEEDSPHAATPTVSMTLPLAPEEPRAQFPHGQASHEALQLPLQESVQPATPTARAMPLRMPPEQRIVSLAIAVPRRDEHERTTALASDHDTPLALPRSITQVLVQLGAIVEVVTDGTVMATMPPSASASDQAFLAVRCGLILAEHLPDVEVAVATGRGHLQGQLPIGEAIDRAFKLLEDCPRARTPEAPRGVWLDTLTEDLLAGRLQIEHEDGRTRAVRAPDATTGEDVRRLLGQPTPCVGREQELATLESILSTCIADSVARAAGVVAPPGMGKSRLRHEFLHRAAQHYPELLVLLGRGEIMNVGAPYGMLGQALRRLCGLAGGEPDAVQTEWLRERLGLRLAGTTAPQIVAFLGELCGVRLSGDRIPAMHAARSDPRVMHEHVKLAFLDWLRAECQAGPVLLVLEDLHWGDALTVQLLEQALRELAELPLFVLTLARPEAQDQFASFWTSSSLQVLPLQVLTRRACERLAQEVLQRALGHAPDAETVDRVVAQSAGHPLYLEELIRAVAEGHHDALPETVLAMLMARLSQLDAGARHVLRAASVFGETFTRDGLAAVLPDKQRTADLDATLAMLVRAEFIEPQRDGWAAPQERFKFRHALVRDAAYSLLTEDSRVVLHRLACTYLEQSGGTDPAVLAEHAYQGNALELAARFCIEAGQQALSSFNLDAAERHARRALECGVRGGQLGAVRAIQAWVANFRLDLLVGYTYALEALEVLRPGSFWWTKTAAICFYSFFMLDRLEHADHIIPAFLIRTFLASEPDPDARLAYLESGAIPRSSSRFQPRDTHAPG
jgi:serine/threonine protein kinase